MFTTRYRNSKERTNELLHQDKKLIWHPFTQMKDWILNEQIVIEKGQGNYLIDTEGNRYLDGVSSLWTTIHGHNHPVINKAIKQQINQISHSTSLGLTNVPAIRFSEKLIQVVPKNLAKIFFSDSGSSAVEIGLKIAYQYWQQHPKSKMRQKKQILSLTQAYHGDTLGAVSVGGIDLFHKIYKPLLFESIKLPAPYPLRQKLSQQEAEQNSLQELETYLKANHSKVAALIIEPLMQGAAGMIKTSVGYLRKIRTLTKNYDVLLIVDEVATGFGRTGSMFASEKADIEPDIMCLAKGISGGYLPLAATLTTETIFTHFLGDYADYRTFYHGHTYTANPLACAAASASLDLFERNHLLESLQEKIYYLIKGLKELNNLKHIAEIRQEGFMVGIELYDDVKNGKPYRDSKLMGRKVCMEAIHEGVFLRPLGDVIILMPPLSITKEELSFLLDITKRCILKVTEKSSIS